MLERQNIFAKVFVTGCILHRAEQVEGLGFFVVVFRYGLNFLMGLIYVSFWLRLSWRVVVF